MNYDERETWFQADARLVTAPEREGNKIEEEWLERSSLKNGDGGVIHPHLLFVAPLCESDLEKTFRLGEEVRGRWRIKRGDE